MVTKSMAADPMMLQHFSVRHLQQISAIAKPTWGECAEGHALPSCFGWMPYWLPGSSRESGQGPTTVGYRVLLRVEHPPLAPAKTVSDWGISTVFSVRCIPENRCELSPLSAKSLILRFLFVHCVCWRAKRGISLAAGRFFWEATLVGSHPGSPETYVKSEV